MAPPDLPLFERDREQAVLSAVIGELRSGRPALVTVTGEPGLGQNELLRWAAGQARARGVHVLAARATSAEHELRYGVVAQLLAPEARDIATRLFVAPQRPGGLPGLNHLLTACHDRPTLLVVQDVQWLDPASLRWLEALARRLPRAPLALLTSTTGTAIDRPEWSVGTPLTGLASTIELALPPLTTSGVSAAVRTVCGVPGDTDFTDALAQATRGVPAVVHEVLLRFTRTGCAPRAEHVEHLRALTAEVVGDHAAQALSELRDPVAVDVLRALAVCGDLLDFPLVCTLAGLHPVPEARLRATLMASGLLTPRDGSPPGHDAVVRARILEEMPAADRADLYARAARLAQRVAVADQGIAELLLRARPVGAPWAVATLRRGFAAALRSGRRDRATAYLARALDEPLRSEERARVELQLASVQMVTAPTAAERRLHGLIRSTGTGTGLRSQAVDLCLLGGDTRAARLAQPTGPGTLGDPAPCDADVPAPRRGSGTGSPPGRRARAVAGDATAPRGGNTSDPSHRDGSDEHPERTTTADNDATVSERDELATVGDRHELATVSERHELIALLRVARFLRHEETCPGVPPAPALPEHSHSPAVAGVRAWEHAMAGVHLEASRRLARAAFAPDPGGRPPLVTPRLFACRALFLTDDGDEAEAHLATLLNEAHRQRAAIAIAHVLAVRADLHLRHGRPDAAARDLAAAEAELPPARLHPLFVPYWASLNLVADLQNGRPDRAREIAARPVPSLSEECATSAYLLFARGVLARSEDDPQRARAYFRACGRWLLHYGCVNPAVLPWRSLAAEAAHALGDDAEALRLTREEVRLAARWGTRSALGRAELGLAVVIRENRTEHFRAAVATLSESPARTDYTRAVLELASAESAEAERRTALALTSRRASTAGGVAPGPLPGFSQALPAPAGVPPGRGAAPHPRPPAGWPALSPAEHETALLAASGLANREIATTLSVTTRAVELRLSGVYRKLRIRGREELRALRYGPEGG
ncbi:LuxR family transcriptional regulator [Streptomyces sp. WAC05458]|uniref:helix-turn-helix transcriptional regulator n=1 Tax=Streptomyces sp. WAC05458 TaxID=2487412 RepID=UPI000F91056F|nr:AAA family ATPase [Streptomyces sp. WAC05458]RSS14906.1 LuxR family transcriptional regulator [Streptomyces sp. WAC05458]